MQCPTCNANLPSAEDNFCGFCGKALFKTCKYCQEKNPVENIFCTNCGQRFMPRFDPTEEELERLLQNLDPD